MTENSSRSANFLAVETRVGFLASAFTVSSVGDWIYRLAFPVLILQLTGSAVSTAMAYVTEFVPYVFFGLVAGAVADRMSRRRLMVVCDTISAALAGLLAFVASQDDSPLWLLYVLALTLASVRAFYFPAFQGYITSTVPDNRLVKLNSFTQTVDSGLGMLGPLVGALLIVAVGAAFATAVNALSFAISALIMWLCQADRQPAAEAMTRPHILVDLADGFRWLLRSRVIWWGTVLLTLSNFAGFMIEGNLVYLGLDALNISKVELSLVFTAQGAGAVLGAALAPRLIARFRTGNLLTIGLVLCAVPPLIVSVFPSWITIIVAWVLDGFGTSLVVVPWFTARQKIVPSALMGRVVSVSRALSYITIPLGALLGGVILSGQGVVALFACAAGLAGIVAIATWRGPLAQIDNDIDRATGRPQEADSAAVDE